MNTPNDGGPAFPRPYAFDNYSAPDAPYKAAQEGMSLRDWFAGQALCGWAAGRQHDTGTYPREKIAFDCYEYADAMIAARGGAK